MRFPYRAVGDYHVDRMQVQRQKCQSRALLIARRLLYRDVFLACIVFLSSHTRETAIDIYSGGNSNGDPPLPIPNREVKPVHAYDTAIPSGKVGSRQLQKASGQVLGPFFVGGHAAFFYAAKAAGAPSGRGALRLVNSVCRAGMVSKGLWPPKAS